MLKVGEQERCIHLRVDSFFALLALTIFTGIILSSSNSLADDTAEASIDVPTACSISGTGSDSHNVDMSSGIYEDDIGTTTIKAYCNDNEGFSIYAIGYTNDQYIGEDHTKLIGNNTNQKITTGTNTSGDTSNWAMKLDTITSPAPTYPILLDNDYDDYNVIPSTYTKVAHRDSGTDTGENAEGATLTTTYAAYISITQPADLYSGKVKYTLVHPVDEVALQPQQATAGYINYFANGSNVVGTMGCQSASDGNSINLLPSNFSRTGYGFAGWSDAYDYATNPNAHFYGPNEDITVPEGTTANGLALYAVWIKSEGTFQDSAKVAELCGAGGTGGSLTAATYSDEGDEDESTWSITANLSSVSALTDTRDGQTYAIAKLTDNKCWMIENLRLADTHTEGNTIVPTTLTTTNTNNPLNDNDPTNPTVTLKHNYTDTQTFTNLSPTSDVAYDESTAPEGWCTTASAACYDQSRLRTDNTTNRASYNTNQTMSANANLYSYGNYYNWYSATAGRGTYGKASGNTEGDLCPAGWHLPTGTGSGEFGLLSNSLGGYHNNGVAKNMTSSTIPSATIMRKRVVQFPNNLIYSGFANNTSLTSRGSYGAYWSSYSVAGGATSYLRFDSSVVYPNTGTYGYMGLVVRCIVTP